MDYLDVCCVQGERRMVTGDCTQGKEGLEDRYPVQTHRYKNHMKKKKRKKQERTNTYTNLRGGWSQGVGGWDYPFQNH